MHVNLDRETGTYSTKQIVNWQTTSAVEFVSFTINGLMPTLSQYVAYDTLSPPNPFIAVTQDGRGNVVYDGGFPKFYNLYTPAAGTPFGSLPGAFKYLYNALNYCSNKAKVNAGNRNVLIIGDAIITENYAVKNATTYGFLTSFQRLFAIAGYNPVFKDRSDYNNTLNPTAAELDGYCAVLLMSSDYSTTTGRLTKEAVAALVAYREAGNGVIIITDHGPELTSADQAANAQYGAFFRTANQITAEFGAYFTGLYDRTPVNVGFIRKTYGDHPLYANMTDAEAIHAGASESRIVIQNYPRYLPGELPQLVMDSGCYLVQILTKLKDGTIEINRVNICIDGKGGERNKLRRLYVRETSVAPWVLNFEKGGWRFYHEDRWLQMLPANTKMWSEELKDWVNVK